jgi:DNA polymerase I
MFPKARKYLDIQLEGDRIICNPLVADAFYNPLVIELLQGLRRHRQNTVYVLKEQDEFQLCPTVAIDIETTALQPQDGDIRLVSVYSEDMQLVTMDPAEVKEILQDAAVKKVFHNAAFDVTWLISKGYPVDNYTDTMVMGQILHNTAKSNNSLQGLALEHLGIVMDKALQADTNWQGELSEQHKQYALMDAKVTYELYHILRQKIAEKHLDVVLDREIGAMPAIVELNLNGLPFDYEAWAVVLGELEEEAIELESYIRQLLNADKLNLSSPLQLIEAFATQGLELESTSDETLAKFESDHLAIESLRKYKKLKKKISTYGEKLRQQIDHDGRVKGQWRLIGTDTSRMSCKKPNLQGLPTIAKQFVKASEGKCFVVADYSTIELRILAELTGDVQLVAAFKNGEDLHKKTARAIFNKDSDEEVTADERKIGKVVNFGLVYGMTAYGLQKKIQSATGQAITLEEAELFRNRYFELYPSVLDFQDRMLKADLIQTLGGRYWSAATSELKKGGISRFNYPIQATGAEGFKVALANLMQGKPSEWRLLAAIHDEIVLEVPEKDAEKATQALIKAMKQGMRTLIPSIPIEIECKTANHWIK